MTKLTVKRAAVTLPWYKRSARGLCGPTSESVVRRLNVKIAAMTGNARAQLGRTSMLRPARAPATLPPIQRRGADEALRVIRIMISCPSISGMKAASLRTSTLEIKSSGKIAVPIPAQMAACWPTVILAKITVRPTLRVPSTAVRIRGSQSGGAF